MRIFRSWINTVLSVAKQTDMSSFTIYHYITAVLSEMLKLSYVLEVFCNKNQISRFDYYDDINKSIQTKRKQCPPRAESNPLTKTSADRSRVPRPLKFLKWAQQMLGDFSFTILNFGIFWTLIQFVQSNSELKWRIQFCNMSARWPVEG